MPQILQSIFISFSLSWMHIAHCNVHFIVHCNVHFLSSKEGSRRGSTHQFWSDHVSWRTRRWVKFRSLFAAILKKSKFPPKHYLLFRRRWRRGRCNPDLFCRHFRRELRPRYGLVSAAWQPPPDPWGSGYSSKPSSGQVIPGFFYLKF